MNFIVIFLYSRDTHAICSGVAKKNGDTCILACPNKPENVNETETKEIFSGQKWRFYDKEHGRDRWSYHHHFRCYCKTDSLANELCFWKPLEPFWMNPMTCNDDVASQMTIRDRLRLGRLRSSAEEVEEAWNNALALKPTVRLEKYFISVLNIDCP